MLKITLDTNCIIDVEEKRPQGNAVKELIRAHQLGDANVALVATSGSEKTLAGTYSVDFSEFESRCKKLGFASPPMLFPIARFDISFFDKAVYADEMMTDLEAEIFGVLFPNSSVDWSQQAKSDRVDVTNTASASYQKWRNKILDAQMFWTHVFNNRDVFVTSDKNFNRKLAQSRFAHVTAVTPVEACAFLDY